jgi:hypothetical protein
MPFWLPPADLDGGPLATRPPATALTAWSQWWAADEAGGTLSLTDGSAWVPVANPTGSQAGESLGDVEPPSSVTVLLPTINTPTRVLGMTTGTFVMPDRPVTALLSPMALTGTTGSLTTIAVRYSTDGWATASNPVTSLAASAGFGFELAPFLIGRVNATPGDNVQVAVFLTRDDTDTVTIVKNAALGLNPLLEVVCR